MGVARCIGRFQVQVALGLEAVEVPEEEVVALLVPLGADPVEEGLGPPGRRLVDVVLHLGGTRPDDEPHLGELAQFLLQGAILEFVVLEPLGIGRKVRGAGVGLDVRHREAVLQDDDVILGRQHFQGRLALEGSGPGVLDPDVPVVVGVVGPAVGRLLGEVPLGDGVPGLLSGVVGFEPGGHAAVPHALARAVVQEEDPRGGGRGCLGRRWGFAAGTRRAAERQKGRDQDNGSVNGSDLHFTASLKRGAVRRTPCGSARAGPCAAPSAPRGLRPMLPL